MDLFFVRWEVLREKIKQKISDKQIENWIEDVYRCHN